MIGAGAIATYVLKKLKHHPHLHVTSLFVRNKKKYGPLAKKYGVVLFTDIEAFLQSQVDVVVEAANVEAATVYIPDVIRNKNLIVVSVGALAEEHFLQQVKQIAKQSGRHIYVPSGAIGGLDLVQNIAHTNDKLDVSLETRKPAHTLTTKQITQEQIVFTGNAANAIKQFPKNINVSIALALAGVGLEKTKVTMIADPNIDKNTHTIQLAGAFGEARFIIASSPLPDNPNTSHLAAYSVIGTLEKMLAPICIG